MTPAPGSQLPRAARWLAVALATNIVLSVAIILGLHVAGESIRLAATATVLPVPLALGSSTSVDSWRPMWAARQQMIEEPDSDLYRIFFVDHVKFQYPPSALLAFDLLPSSPREADEDGGLPPSIRGWINWLSRGAVLITILSTMWILKLGLERMRAQDAPAQDTQPQRARHLLLTALAIGLALALTYYPMHKAYQLGQIQVLMNAAIALGLLCYLRGNQAIAGVCIGLCCLIKPQYGLLLLWGLLRRRMGFVLGGSLTLGVGLAASIASYGFTNHVRYLQVLQAISRDGEAFWPNQSMNGFMQRLLGNGSALEFSHNSFPPFHPVVYAATLLSSVALLVLAFWLRGSAKRESGGPIDFAIVLVAATIASPVAWEHHYGAFVAVFALALPYAMKLMPFGRATAPLLCISYAAVANVFLRPHALLANPVLGVLASHMYFGALVLVALLLAIRSDHARAVGTHGAEERPQSTASRV